MELKIGDNVIADVTEVPFEYTYTFPKDQQTGELTISLGMKRLLHPMKSKSLSSDPKKNRPRHVK